MLSVIIGGKNVIVGSYWPLYFRRHALIYPSILALFVFSVVYCMHVFRSSIFMFWVVEAWEGLGIFTCC